MQVGVSLWADERDRGDDAEDVSLEGQARRRDHPRPSQADEMSDCGCSRREQPRPVLERLDLPALDAARLRGRETNVTGVRWSGNPRSQRRSQRHERDEDETLAQQRLQYVTTNDVRNEPALPQATRIGHRPGVVLVPTFHVQDTRPPLGRFA